MLFQHWAAGLLNSIHLRIGLCKVELSGRRVPRLYRGRILSSTDQSDPLLHGRNVRLRLKCCRSNGGFASSQKAAYGRWRIYGPPDSGHSASVLTAGLTHETSNSAPALLALVLRNPGPHARRVDTLIHRSARDRYSRLETVLYQRALRALVAFAPSVALRTDHRNPSSCSLIYTCPRWLNMDR